MDHNHYDHALRKTSQTDKKWITEKWWIFSQNEFAIIDGMENYFSTYDSLMVINDVKETKASPTANGN